MGTSLMESMADEQRYLVDHAMADMDLHYDDEMKLLRSKENPQLHYTRGSAHYAIGLLLRNTPGTWKEPAAFSAR
ncbi:hypothetical protein LJK87_38780 [Paenibacillus sp. P25]|nr:hypothetical protein LJK87_38780 [Paenibacillus sp. P25]